MDLQNRRCYKKESKNFIFPQDRITVTILLSPVMLDSSIARVTSE
jgi:hypothetical protein